MNVEIVADICAQIFMISGVITLSCMFNLVTILILRLTWFILKYNTGDKDEK